MPTHISCKSECINYLAYNIRDQYILGILIVSIIVIVIIANYYLDSKGMAFLGSKFDNAFTLEFVCLGLCTYKSRMLA